MKGQAPCFVKVDAQTYDLLKELTKGTNLSPDDAANTCIHFAVAWKEEQARRGAKRYVRAKKTAHE